MEYMDTLRLRDEQDWVGAFYEDPEFVVTPDFVTGIVDTISSIAHDDELAHFHEDRLMALILRSIADGRCSDPIECCKIALKTEDINFSRWCA